MLENLQGVTGWDLVLNTINDEKSPVFVRTVALKGICECMTTLELVRCMSNTLSTQSF